MAGDSGVKSYVLPIAALAIGPAAALARIVRVEGLKVLDADYIRTARGKRLPARLIYLRHALPNMLTATLTIAGLLLGGLIAGTVLIESIFAWTGLGSTLVSAVTAKDYPSVQAVALIFGAFILVINFVVDMAARRDQPAVDDPRPVTAPPLRALARPVPVAGRRRRCADGRDDPRAGVDRAADLGPRRGEDRHLGRLAGIIGRPSAGHRRARPRHPAPHPRGRPAVRVPGGSRHRARRRGRHPDRGSAGARGAPARPADHERDQPRRGVPDSPARDLHRFDRRPGRSRRGDRDRGGGRAVLRAPQSDARGLGGRRGLHRRSARPRPRAVEADAAAHAAECGGAAAADADADDGRRTPCAGGPQSARSRGAAALLRLGRHAHRGSPADLRHADRRGRPGGGDHLRRARVQPARREPGPEGREAGWLAAAEPAGARRSSPRAARIRRGAGRRRTWEVAGHPRPHRGVSRRLGAGPRRLDHGRARGDRGHRRRVGVGQELDRDGDCGASACPSAGHVRATPALRSGRWLARHCRPAPAARALARDRLPGSDGVAQPRVARRPPARRGRRGARGALSSRGEETQRRAPAVGADRLARAAGPQLSARALGRHATAGHDRHGPDGHPSADHRGRADHRSRRHGPAADHQAAGRHRDFHRGGGDLHLARHRGRLADLPAGARDVRGPGRRGARRRDLGAAARPSVHGGAAGIGPDDGVRPRAAAGLDSRSGSRPVRPIARLPVRTPLPCSVGSLPQRASGADAACDRSPRRLLAPELRRARRWIQPADQSRREDALA